jgi:glycosyltransferase involved in cell wall biosynthesis
VRSFLYIANVFPPSADPGVYRTLKLARYLPEHDLRPVVVTPRSPTGARRDTSLLSQLPDSVRVVRTASLGFSSAASRTKDRVRRRWGEGKNTLLGRALRAANDSVFFMDPQMGWAPFAYRAARRLVLSGEADRALVTGFPFSSFLVGEKLRRRLGVPWAADFRDAWTLAEEGWSAASPRRRARCEKWEARFLESASRVVFVSETTRRLYHEKYPWLSEGKTRVIPNGYDPRDFEGLTPRRFPRPTLLFLGTVYEGTFSLEPLLAALASLARDGRLSERPLRVVFAGHLPERWLARVREEGLEDVVRYEGFLSHRDALAALMGADALYLLLASGPRWEQTIPGKIFEYLHSGAPIVGAVPEGGESARLLERAGAGPIFPPDDAAAHRRALEDLLDGKLRRADPDRRARLLEPFTRRSLAGRMAGVLEDLASLPAAAARTRAASSS